MKRFLPLLMILLLPSVAMAHAGHGGLGVFHHFIDMAPALTLLVLAIGGAIWINKRK